LGGSKNHQTSVDDDWYQNYNDNYDPRNETDDYSEFSDDSFGYVPKKKDLSNCPSTRIELLEPFAGKVELSSTEDLSILSMDPFKVHGFLKFTRPNWHRFSFDETATSLRLVSHCSGKRKSIRGISVRHNMERKVLDLLSFEVPKELWGLWYSTAAKICLRRGSGHLRCPERFLKPLVKALSAYTFE